MTATVSSSTSQFILSLISILDAYGAEEWDLRKVAAVTAAILLLMRMTIGHKYDVDWDALVHAFITGWGAVACVYLNIYSSEEISGVSEPLRSIQCAEPLTSLHRILPAITQGYAVCDIINGFSLGREFLAHGIATFTVMTIFVELNASSIILPMLVMEISTILLACIRGTFWTSTMQIFIQALFAVSFFFCRVIFTPISYYEIVTTMHTHQGHCYPRFLFYVTLLFGAFFNCLNAYWFIKILKKISRKFNGEEKMGDVSKSKTE